ncbi:MAG: response regulator [Nitrospirota bacterium]
MAGKVLLVDDTEFYQRAYKNKLTTEGYLVTTASNGVEALKHLAQEPPDIVLLDLMMPVMDGFKVLQAIKADARLKTIPVIIFSAKGATDEVEQAITLGANDYLVKATTTPNKVVEKIRQVLSAAK